MSGYERYTYTGFQNREGEMPLYRNNETTRLVIEEDTIYEIDLQCEECHKKVRPQDGKDI